MEKDRPIREMKGNRVLWYWGAPEKDGMVKGRPVRRIAQRFDSLVWERLIEEMSTRWMVDSEFAKKEAENKALRQEIARLKTELEEAKRQRGDAHGEILMHSAVDALLHQAKSMSALVFDREGSAAPSAGR